MEMTKKDRVIKTVFIIIGIVFILDTVFISIISNFNAGVIMPAILGAPLLAIGCFYEEFKKFFKTKKGKIIKRVIIILYIVFTVAFLVAFVLINSADYADNDTKADAVIVLGAAVKGDEPSLTLKKRLDRAIDYLEENEDAICIVTGGLGNQERKPEAVVMKEYLLEKGIEEDIILSDDSAKDTTENFKNSKKLANDYFGEGNYEAVFVTSDFHVYRAGEIAKKFGFSGKGLAADSNWYIVPNFYLRECLSIWYGMFFD